MQTSRDRATRNGTDFLTFLALYLDLAIPTDPAVRRDGIETKYIFGNFMLAQQLESRARRRSSRIRKWISGSATGAISQLKLRLEFEYTPTQYFQIELGPTVSYYNIHNVPGLDDRNMGCINGIEAEFRSLIVDRGPSPIAVTLSIEREWHSLDEISGAAVSNYGLETRIEADAELIKNPQIGFFSASISSMSRRRRSFRWARRSTNRLSGCRRR